MSVESTAQSILIRISKRKQKKALETLKLAIDERKYNPDFYSEYKKKEFHDALSTTIGDALKVLGYRVLHVSKDSDDDYELALKQGLSFTAHNTVNITGYLSEFWQYDDRTLWQILAPFVKTGSYIAYTMEESHGLFVFNKGVLTILDDG